MKGNTYYNNNNSIYKQIDGTTLRLNLIVEIDINNKKDVDN